jgi:hypothetical protein
MKTLTSVIAIALLTVSARAEDTLMDGGRSPNGNYEVRIANTAAKDPPGYAIHIHAVAAAKPLSTLDGTGGHLRYQSAVERCRAVWHSSSRLVAVTDQAARHSRDLYVLAVYPDRTERLELPDYVQNALGRINATSVDFACVSNPKRWDGDDLIVELYFTANGRHSYTCEVALHVTREEQSAPSISLKSVSKPKQGEG